MKTGKYYIITWYVDIPYGNPKPGFSILEHEYAENMEELITHHIATVMETAKEQDEKLIDIRVFVSDVMFDTTVKTVFLCKTTRVSDREPIGIEDDY